MDGAHLCDGFQRMRIKQNDGNTTNSSSTNNSTNNPSRPRNEFKDITAEFLEASNSLVIGQLVQDPQFTLLEAVGALELMDPKMDSGLIQSVEADTFDVLAPAPPDKVIGVIDQLICCEMAWHNGSALSQTVFTSMYVDRLLSQNPGCLKEATFGDSTIPDEPRVKTILRGVLRSYCLGTLKCCNCVNTQVLQEASYEDEDFVTQTYNISLLDSIDAEDIIDCLKTSLEALNEVWQSIPVNLITAIENRLAHRMAFLRAVSKPVPLYYQSGATEWEDVLALTEAIEGSYCLGSPMPRAFSTSVQRKLASTVPPRPKVELAFHEAMVNIKNMCNEVKDMVKIVNYESPSNILTFIIHFGARKPSPSTYVRTLLQSVLLNNGLIVGKVPIKDFVLQDLQELTNPHKILLDPLNDLAETPHNPRYKIAKRISWFTDAGGNLLIDLLQKQCMNRSRLRRQLCHTIVDWDRLQAQAEDIDAELREITQEQPLIDPSGGNSHSYAYPLSSWAFHYKLLQMEWIVLLGFELDIYQPYEHAGMYWIAQDYVRARIRHLERIHAHTLNSAHESKEITRHTLSYVTSLILQASATQDLIGALLHAHTILLATSTITAPPQPFSTPELRYELRMKPFTQVNSPEAPPWDCVPWEYFNPNEIYSSLTRSEKLAEANASLSEAKVFISEAKRQFELVSKMKPKMGRFLLCEDLWKENVKELLRSCIGVSVALVGLEKMLRALGEQKHQLEEEEAEQKRWAWKIERGNKRYHEWFGVVSVWDEKGRERKGKNEKGKERQK